MMDINDLVISVLAFATGAALVPVATSFLESVKEYLSPEDENQDIIIKKGDRTIEIKSSISDEDFDRLIRELTQAT